MIRDATRAVKKIGIVELSLAFPQHTAHVVFEYDGIRYVNVMAPHIDAAIDVAASES